MLNEYLFLLRKYSGMTQADAAQAGNIKLSKYKSYESGEKIADEYECRLLSEMLGFDDDVLSESKEHSIAQKLFNLLENNPEEDVYKDDSNQLSQRNLSEAELKVLLAYRYCDEQNKKLFEDLAYKILNNK